MEGAHLHYVLYYALLTMLRHQFGLTQDSVSRSTPDFIGPVDLDCSLNPQFTLSTPFLPMYTIDAEASNYSTPKIEQSPSTGF